eukprot:4254532-Amphidinium_carterae.1
MLGQRELLDSLLSETSKISKALAAERKAASHALARDQTESQCLLIRLQVTNELKNNKNRKRKKH